MSPEMKQAIQLIKSGQKEAGKEILLQILEHDDNNDTAWLWMSATVDTDELRLECLEEALRINPNNETAQRGYQKITQRLRLKEEKELEDVWHAEPGALKQPPPWEEQTTTIPKPQSEWSYEKYQKRPEPEINTAVANKPRNPLKTSPWITIFYAPRATVSAILQSNEPQKHTLLIPILWGIMLSLTISFPFIFLDWRLFAVMLGITLLLFPISSLIGLYISALIYGWLGFFVGGTGSSKDVRTALAWSYVPYMFVFLCNILFILFFVRLISSIDPTDINAALPQIIEVVTPIFYVNILLNLWPFYIFLKCLSAAHRYSAWRALATVFLPILTIYILTFILSLLASFTS